MIKHGRYYLTPSLEIIFNDIIDNGTFPTEWNIGVTKAIYKQKGDKKSPANYRGITLTSCLGKLFTSILQNRLNKFIEQHDVLNQFGFRPTPELRIVYLFSSNYSINTPNSTRSFMLALLTTRKLSIAYGNLG